MELAMSEAMLFKYGSGTGTDLSSLRSTREKLSGGGKPSGPLSFLKVYDQVANVVKSGGKTRRAAKMNTLKDWHPDIEEFIDAKQKEEKKAWALIEQGYDGSYNGDAYGSVMYQNENLSVRVSDDFMNAAVEDREWWTRRVRDGSPCERKEARTLLRKIAEGTHICGDPGMQFDTTIHKWHTCKGTGRQNSTNPCSEYLFLDNTACNLASLNLMKFKTEDGTFDVERFKAAVRVFITAQEIIVDNASYPIKEIAENSHIFRTLGLGYANLGSLIMSYGYGYDSVEGRAICGAITAIMTGEAYAESARMAGVMGPFPGYRDARASGVPKPVAKDNVAPDARSDRATSLRRPRNSRQRRVRLPERRSRQSLGPRRRARPGTRLSQRPGHRPRAHRHDQFPDGLRHDRDRARHRAREIQAPRRRRHVENRQPDRPPRARETRLQLRGDRAHHRPHRRSRHHRGRDRERRLSHRVRPEAGASLDLRLRLQALQRRALVRLHGPPPDDGGGPALPQRRHFQDGQHAGDATVDEIMNTYIEGWRLGLKAIAIYRDSSKRSAPLNTRKTKDMGGSADGAVLTDREQLEARIVELDEEIANLRGQLDQPVRHRMSDTRMSLTHKFEIAGHEGYITVGLYEDGQPGELFIHMSKEGSTIGGLMDTVATLTSMALQYGVPLESLVKKFAYQRFEPSGFTKNPDIRNASSITDYVFRWLGCQFIKGYKEATSPNRAHPELPLKEIADMEKKAVNRPVADLSRTGDKELIDVITNTRLTKAAPRA